MQISNRTLHGSSARGDIRKFGGGERCTLVIASEENVQNVNKITAEKKSMQVSKVSILPLLSCSYLSLLILASEFWKN